MIANARQHLGGHPDSPAVLFEIQRTHGDALNVSHRKRRDSLELRSQHGSREHIREAPVFHQGFHESDDFRELLNLVDKDECIALNQGLLGEHRDAGHKIRRIPSFCKGFTSVGVKQQVGLVVDPIVRAAEVTYGIAFANLARPRDEKGLMRDSLPLQKTLSDLATQHTGPLYTNW